jgi:hypothetical protein
LCNIRKILKEEKMTRLHKILFVMATLCALALPWGQSVAGGGDPKVVICHYPPGNPANAHTIIVGNSAVSAHVNNHGDTRGACDMDGDGGNDDSWSMTTICHIPPGNPANAHTIIVGAPAVPAHVGNHGDCLGPCPCAPGGDF